MAVTIRIWAYPDSYLVINGQRVRPGSYQVSRGSSVTFMVNAKNHGTAGSAWLGIRNKDTGEILKWKSYSVKEGQVFYYSGTITANNDMNLELVGGQLTNEGRIIQHSYGTWSITVKEPVPSVPAKARIANIGIIEPNGQTHSITSDGGSATVASQTVKVIVTLSNVGGASGKLSAELLVNGSSKGIKTTSRDVPTGGVSTVSWDNVQLLRTSNTLTVRAGH